MKSILDFNTVAGLHCMDTLSTYTVASNFVSTVWKALCQHDGTHVHKAGSIKKWFSQFDVVKLDLPAQSPGTDIYGYGISTGIYFIIIFNKM